MKLEAVGENRWDLLDNIENSMQSTLKDIMDMLTEGEKAMLMDPFAVNDPLEKLRRRNEYNLYRRLNSCVDREGSIEDIQKIRQFFLFKEGRSYGQRVSGVNFRNFLNELQSFTPEQGLLKYLDDAYLRQKLENVDDYMVPKTLAPILKTLLRKYRADVRGMLGLTPAMRSIISTLLCIVIDKMCRTKVEHITRDDLKNWHFYLAGIEKLTAYKLTGNKAPFTEIMRAFLGFEAIRFEQDIREKLDHKMATLEAELKRCKAYREKLKEDTSVMSDFMKECSSVASKWKHRSWGDEWF